MVEVEVGSSVGGARRAESRRGGDPKGCESCSDCKARRSGAQEISHCCVISFRAVPSPHRPKVRGMGCKGGKGGSFGDNGERGGGGAGVYSGLQKDSRSAAWHEGIEI